jgi:hypothetical protein
LSWSYGRRGKDEGRNFLWVELLAMKDANGRIYLLEGFMVAIGR